MTETDDNCEDLFVGREWVFAKVEKTLDVRTQMSANTGVTAIFGCAGSGKTVLLQRFSRIKKLNDYLLAFVECNESIDLSDFIDSVETQIKNKLQIENNLNNESNERLAVDDLFRQAVLFPLLEAKNIDKEAQRYLIVIDSIDTNAEVCQLIANQMHLLPKWVHLVVSARPKRRKGFTKMFSGSRKIVIDDMRKLNVINDMKTFIMSRVKRINCRPLGTAGKKALNQIGIKSNGCFLYVKLILDCLERGVMRTSEVDAIGATLNGLYLALCTKLFDSNPDSELHFKAIISLIIASIGLYVTKECLQECLKWDEHFLQTKLDQLCSHSILEIKIDDTIELTHTSLIEWITDVKHCTNRFLCDQSMGHIIYALTHSLHNLNEYHFHLLNARIPEFSIHHYALWLLLAVDSSVDLDMLTELMEESPIISFIQKCNASVQSNFCSNQTFSLKNTNSAKCLSNEGFSDRRSKQKSIEYNLMNEVPTNDCEYEELLSQFKRALLDCDIPTIKDILTNDSTDMLNDYVINQKTPLYWAIKSANTTCVELLLEFEADVNLVCDTETGLTPLMVAVSHNSYEICEVLLDNDADVDASDALSRTPIVHAILEHSSYKIIELMLFWGAHTDYIDSNGASLLCLAAKEAECSVDSIRILSAVGCDEMHKDNNGRTPLHMAAAVGNADIVEALLDIGGETLLMSRDNDGKLALHDCAIGGYIETARHLISEESIKVLSHDGKSALRLAALSSHLDFVTLLVEKGADVNYTDADGRTTVYCVASSAANDLKLINTLHHLVKLGADLEIKDLEGRTPLHVTSWQGMTAVVRALVELGADIDAVDNEGRTALHMCAWNGHTEVVALLIEAGANVNHVSSTQGATPLMIAAQQGHIDACSLLLNAGSDPSHIDFYGRSAKEVANNCGNRDISVLLDSRTHSVDDRCPTISSHASTAETAAIGELEALFDASKNKMESSGNCLAKSQSSRKHKKVMSISKLTKLLH